MIKKEDKNKNRTLRHKRVRTKISGSTQKPRLCVYRSLTEIYAQIVNDETKMTLVSASSKEKDISEKVLNKSKKEQAQIVGEILAKRALEKNITTVVFDRGGYIYTGRIASLAQGARNAGLKF